MNQRKPDSRRGIPGASIRFIKRRKASWRRRANALLRIVSHFFVLVFALVFVWWGIEFSRFGWDQLSEIAELPMWMIFIAWPVAGFTWVLFIGESFVTNLRILREDAPQ